MRGSVLGAMAFVLVCLPAVARGDDWPQFRGPNGSATSADQKLPLEWGSDKNVVWKAKLPGYGWSSPIVWGDKVFVTTAISDKQRKPTAGFGGRGGFGGGRPGEGGGGGGGGFRFRPQPGQVLSPFIQERLNLTADQKKKLEDVQKEVDTRLDKLLTEEQKKQLKESRSGPPRGGRGGFGGFPQPGQILSAALEEELKLTAEQKKQREQLQKEVDTHLEKLLTAEQKKQLKDMREGFGRGGFGGMQRPPDAIYKLEVYCLDRASGKVLWKELAYEGKPRIPTQASNTYATETPVTDGERVYAYFGMHGVYCYDLQGKQIWKKDLGSYRMAMGYGTGGSPALADGRLFIQCDNDEKSFLAALDAKTGKELWRTPRPERTGFSTPLIWKNKVRTEVVCLGNPRVRSYDPATGKQLWELGGMSGQAKASPVGSAELLYVGTGGGPAGFGRPGGGGGGGGGRGGAGGNRPLFAVKAGASGDITLKSGTRSNDGIAWYQPKAGPQTASPLLYEGRLYVLDERGGLLVCLDARTGEEIYKERLSGARGFTSSPWAMDGKIYCLDDAGTTFVVQAGPEFKVLKKNTIDEMCWSSPAIAGRALFLRTVDHLYCLKQSEGEK